VTIQHPAQPVRCCPPVGRGDVPENRRRGGDIRVLLSPATVGAQAGFLGTLTLQPGEIVTEHWHPYSEEFLYCASGSVTVTLGGTPMQLSAEQAVHVPLGVKHRIVNDGAEPATFVFALGPLAPRPELGHVDTEPLPAAVPAVQPAPTPVGAKL
jgi:putative monooxygenase